MKNCWYICKKNKRGGENIEYSIVLCAAGTFWDLEQDLGFGIWDLGFLCIKNEWLCDKNNNLPVAHYLI